MKPATAHSSASKHAPDSVANSVGENRIGEPDLPGLHWPWRKIFFLVLLALLIHVALICFFGTIKQIIPRTVTRVPRLQLVGDANPFIALNNPALFALPNPRDFSSAIWLRVPVVVSPSFRWDESPQWLSLAPVNPAAAFQQFLQSNVVAQIQLMAKPPPAMPPPSVSLGAALPSGSTFKIVGSLARRMVLNPAALPSLPYDNVIPPSKVQVLVDTTGHVISAILLPLTDSMEAVERYDAADQAALGVARGLHFTPAKQLAFGEIIFHWHTIPALQTPPPVHKNST
jgi:hypothetical protein